MEQMKLKNSHGLRLGSGALRRHLNAGLVLSAAIFGCMFSASAASNRARAEHPHSVSVLTSELRETLGANFLGAYFSELQGFASGTGFSRSAMAMLKPSDQVEMKPILKGARLPVIRREGNTYLFSDGTATMRLRWADFPELKFDVNGVNWEYKPRKPLRFQIELLAKRLEFMDKHSMLQFFEPRAHALAIPQALIGSAITAIVMLVINRSWDNGVFGTCWLLDQRDAAEQYSFCGDYVTQSLSRKESLRQKQTVKVDIGTPKAADQTQASTFWDPGWNKQCPTDKAKNSYIGDVQPVQMAGGKAVSFGGWSTVRIDLQTDGINAKSGFTAPAGTDMNAADAISKATNSFKFDETGSLLSFDTPNPAYKSGDPASKPTVTVDMAIDDSKLDPDLRSRRDQVKSLLQAIKNLISACVCEEQKRKIEEQQRQSENKSPGPIAPTAPMVGPNLPPEPPAPTVQ